MKEEIGLTRQIATSEGLQIKQSVVILVAAICMPMLTHLIPVQSSTPMGAMLLPIFYAPFIALIFFRFHVALIPALLAPVVSHFITGHPAMHLLPVMTTELVMFVGIAYLLLNKAGKLAWVAAPLAYIAAKAGSMLLLTIFPSLLNIAPLDFAIASIGNAIVGIGILLVINIVCLRLKK